MNELLAWLDLNDCAEYPFGWAVASFPRAPSRSYTPTDDRPVGIVSFGLQRGRVMLDEIERNERIKLKSLVRRLP